MIENLFLRNWRPYAWLALVIVAVFGPSLFFGFVCYDDNVLIRDRLEFLGNPAYVGKAFLQHYFAAESQGGHYYRPWITLSYMTDTWIGGGKPWAYHATNLALHIAVTGLVFMFFRTLLAGMKRDLAAFLAALVFAVHPLQVMAVGWIPGRNDMWLAFFMLVGLLAFMRQRKTGSPLWMGVHLAAFVLGLLSKESAICLPLLCGVWLWLVEGKSRVRELMRDLPLIAWVGILFVWLFMRSLALGIVLTLDPFVTFGPLERISVMTGLMLRYFGKILIPVGMALIPDMAESTALYGALGLVLLVGVYVRRRSPEDRLMAFGMILGVSFLALSVPFSHTMGVRNLGLLEHRMYMPLVGFLAAWLIGIGWRSRVAPILALAFVAMLGMVTVERLPALSDMQAFWSRAVKESPQSTDAWHNYGCVQVSVKRTEEAIAAFARSLELDPHRPMSYFNLGGIYYNRGQYGRAIENLKKELENNRYSFKACDLLAETYYKSGDVEQSKEWRRRANELRDLGLK